MRASRIILSAVLAAIPACAQERLILSVEKASELHVVGHLDMFVWTRPLEYRVEGETRDPFPNVGGVVFYVSADGKNYQVHNAPDRVMDWCNREYSFFLRRSASDRGAYEIVKIVQDGKILWQASGA